VQRRPRGDEVRAHRVVVNDRGHSNSVGSVPFPS
jgi:hypothetical protein